MNTIKIILLSITLMLSSCNHSNITNIDAKEFKNIIENKEIQLLDVRTIKEFKESHIKGATLIDIKKSSFMEMVDKKIDKKKPIAIYCRSGKRAMIAAKILIKKGYKVEYNLKGGIIEWNKLRTQK